MQRSSALARQIGLAAGVSPPLRSAVWILRFQPARHASAQPIGAHDGNETKEAEAEAEAKPPQKAVSSYWGVPPSRFTKEDGSTWRWACFRVIP